MKWGVGDWFRQFVPRPVAALLLFVALAAMGLLAGGVGALGILFGAVEGWRGVAVADQLGGLLFFLFTPLCALCILVAALLPGPAGARGAAASVDFARPGDAVPPDGCLAAGAAARWCRWAAPSCAAVTVETRSYPDAWPTEFARSADSRSRRRVRLRRTSRVQPQP